MSEDSGIPSGQQRPGTSYGEYNQLAFIIGQHLSRMETVTLVRVDACTNNGGLSPVGFVDVTPLVNQIDGQANPTPHVTIHNVPYLRMQGGANAVILDPEVGDIGIAAFASRDISKVKATKAQANPGSFRQYDFSDALYMGGVLNGAPTQYVQFNAVGIKILSTGALTLEAESVELTATDVAIVSATLTHNGVNIGATHVHGDVTSGASNTGTPT